MSSVSTTNIFGTDNDFDRPSGTAVSLCIAIQALRAWLLSACPSGTKAIHPSMGKGTRFTRGASLEAKVNDFTGL